MGNSLKRVKRLRAGDLVFLHNYNDLDGKPIEQYNDNIYLTKSLLFLFNGTVSHHGSYEGGLKLDADFIIFLTYRDIREVGCYYDCYKERIEKSTDLAGLLVPSPNLIVKNYAIIFQKNQDMYIGKEIPDALRRAGHEPYISLFRQMQDRFG